MLAALLLSGCTATPTAISPADQSPSRPADSPNTTDPEPTPHSAETASPAGTSTVANPSHEATTTDQATSNRPSDGLEPADATSPTDVPPDLVIRPSDPAPPAPSSPPTVRVTGPTVGPSYPPALVRRVIRTHVKRLRHCYQIELQRNPNVGGKLVVAFDIVADGTVQKARVASSATGSDELDRCVVGVLATLTFPRPPGGATLHVRYPLLFAPAA